MYLYITCNRSRNVFRCNRKYRRNDLDRCIFLDSSIAHDKQLYNYLIIQLKRDSIVCTKCICDKRERDMYIQCYLRSLQNSPWYPLRHWHRPSTQFPFIQWTLHLLASPRSPRSPRSPLPVSYSTAVKINLRV